MSPVFSIIIPVYNDARFLNRTIRSWVSQTFKQIEIIMIDDGSTDESADIINEWAQKDNRIRIITLTQNVGPWTARNYGVEKANGRYIMFCDADDSVVLNTCEVLYKDLQSKPVDILQFGTKIINVNGLPKDRMNYMQRFLASYPYPLKGKEILLKCFQETKYRWNLCNKVFSAALCRKALLNREQVRLTYAEDALAYFMIAYYARSYRSHKGDPLYCYYYGRGITGQIREDRKTFREVCDAALVVKQMRAFLALEKAGASYESAVRSFEKIFLRNSVNHFLNHVEEADKGICFDKLIDKWPASDVLTQLASKKDLDCYKLAGQIKSAEIIQFKPRPIRTIATYYFSVANGGIERVMCKLCYLWLQMGYRVVLITEDNGQKGEYEFPKEIKRVILPDRKKSEGERYLERAEAIRRCIKENCIDVVVYHAWLLELAFFDELAIKAAGSAFVFYCHGVFATPLIDCKSNLKTMVTPARLSDAVVTLSETDSTFWAHFSNNVLQVKNPFAENYDEWIPSSCEGHAILWVARISPEKRPFDALEILKLVLRAVPDAKLHIVGAAWVEKYEMKFKRAVIQAGLAQNVIMHGFQMNVKPFYQNAAVFLMTSEFEGYSLTLQESMAAGLPIVMYRLPYLALVRDNQGVISVEQLDIEAAAGAIIELLCDDNKRKLLGKESRKYMDGFAEYDYEGRWRDVFDSIAAEHEELVTKESQLMMETLVNGQGLGAKKKREAIRYGERKTVKLAVRTVKMKDDLHDNGLKSVLSRGITKLKECNHDNGIQYTIKKILEKITL